jgi:hypothetical protein
VSVVWDALSLVVASSGAVVAYIALRSSRSKDRVTGMIEDQKRLDQQQADQKTLREDLDRLTRQVTDGLAGGVTRAADLEARCRQLSEDLTRLDSRNSQQVAGMAEKVALLERARDRDDQTAREVADLTGRVGVLDKQIEVFWRNVALDVSHILHSPHPGWENLDALLERYRAGLRRAGPEMTQPEMADLEDQLRNLVEGQFPGEVSRVDQVAASLLLHAIEQTRGTQDA